jgi:hypothetical protein
MKESMDLGLDNVALACKEFASSEVYATRTMAGLQSDLQQATNAASELASIQVQKARQALLDAASAINESVSANKSLNAFAETNPCVTDDLISIAGGRSTFLLAYLAMPLLVCMLSK